MASYGFNLYFSKKVDRKTAAERILALPDCKPDPNSPDDYWSERVHLRLSQSDQTSLQKQIQRDTGLEVGDFYVAVRVHTAEEEAFLQKWDRILALLSDRVDAIAIKEFCAIMLTQRDGQLTLDSSGEDLSPHYRDYILSKRPAQLAPLGLLTESE